jgi:adenosine deaminase
MTKFISTYLFVFFVTNSSLAQQSVDTYFNAIRKNEVLLTAFFQNMPKGGDLHHHYTGSIYAETYLDYVIDKNYWINKQTLEVVENRPPIKGDSWAKFSSLKSDGTIAEYKQKLMERWSVKDYNNASLPRDKHFFETFGYFGVANGAFTEENETYRKGLLELKARAISEHVQYIETLFTKVPISNELKKSLAPLNSYNEALRKAKNNDGELSILLDTLFIKLELAGIKESALKHCRLIDTLHNKLKIDEENFMLRYQNYVARTVDPVDIFTQLVGAFISADNSKNIVGVNIVSPEDNDISMQDYLIHMKMFRYCKQKFPNIKCSMHAGELTIGLVKPESLTSHIKDAVEIGGAKRIGHGVDIAHEADCYALLEKMKTDSIAVEINLTSNEFILNIKDDKHPILLYQLHNVPIVICTDDAGILRTNLTEQYVILAKRYPEISYGQIKQYVMNSIIYSFIEEADLKDALLKKINEQFSVFERKFIGSKP